MLYQAKVSLNKNENVTFESDTEEKLTESMRNTLKSERFKNDVINSVLIYEVKQIKELTYEELLNQ
jgi:hypothetical protein